MITGTKTEKCQKEWTGAKHVKVNAEKEGRWIQGEVSLCITLRIDKQK